MPGFEQSMFIATVGGDPDAARSSVTRFAEHDERRLNEYHSQHNDKAKMRELARESARALEEMFARDASDMTGTNA